MNANITRSHDILKWSMMSAVLTVAATLAWTLGPRLVLAGRFYLAAGAGKAELGGITSNDMDALVAYSPQQIAVYLDSSNKTWQAVACGVLATQAERGTVTDWDGIGPGLAQVVLQDNNPSVTQLALTILESIPSFSASDILSMMALLRRSEPSDSRRAVWGIILGKNGDAADELRELLGEWADSSVQRDRVEAVVLLSKFFPDDARVATLLNEAATDWPNESDATPVVSSVLANRPDLVPDLMRGTPRQQRLALRAMSGREAAFPPELNDAATALAADLVASEEPETVNTAVGFLASPRQKDAGHLLVGALLHVDAETKVSVLGSLRQIAWDAFQRNDGSFQFTGEEGNTLVRLLNDPSPAVRAAAAQVVNPGIPPGPRPQGAFVPGTGPLDLSNADAFRRLLDFPTGELDWLALNYFTRVTPFQESDIPLVVRAIRRDEETLRASGTTQATGTAQAHLAFTELLQRFPKHSETRSLARECFLAGKFQDAAKALFEKVKPDDSEALSLAQELFLTSTSDAIVLAAASYLWRSPAHRSAVQTAIVQRYRTSRATGGLAVQRTSSIRWARLILTVAREPGTAVDSSIVKEILTDVFSQLWFGEARVEDVPDRKQIETALAADAIAECERAAVRKCLEERVFSKQVAAQSNSVAYCVQAMQHVPGFRDEATRAATQAIESDDGDSRMRGLYLMAAARLDSAAMKDRAVERLDDRDFVVRAAAADALGALGINESRVIEKLRGMVDRKQPEPVRTAGVRNLALLAPQDLEIVKLIQSLAEDANFGTRTEARRALRAIDASR